MDNPASRGGGEPVPLRFACVHCETALTVPRRFAGIRGPCPMCGGIISAPESAMPPQKSGLIGGSREAPPRTAPPGGLADNPPPGAGGGRTGPSGIPRLVAAARPAYPLRCPDRGERLRRIEEQSRRLRRKGRIVIATLLGMGAAVAVLVSVCADHLTLTPRQRRAEAQALRAAHAADAKADGTTTGHGVDSMIEVRKDRAIEQSALLAAQQIGLKFLRSREWAETRMTLGPPASEWETAPRAFRDFAGEFAGETTLELIHSRRIPHTGRFFSTWRAVAAENRSITLVVEDAGGGPRLRWDAIEQQVTGALAAFSRQPGANSPARFYVRLGSAAQPPGAGRSLLVDVSSPFAGKDDCNFKGIIDDREGQALQWRQLLDISTPRETFASLEWRRLDDGTPIIAVNPVASGPWTSPTPAVASAQSISSPTRIPRPGSLAILKNPLSPPELID